MSRARLATGAACALALCAAPAPAQPRQPIIDMHLHAHSLADYGGGMPGCTNRGPLEFPPVDPRDGIGFGSALVTCPDSAMIPPAASDRIVPATYFDVGGTVTPEWVRRLVATDSIRALAEVGAQYDGALADDPRLAAFFVLAEELDVPVGIHLGEGPPGGSHTLGGSPYRVRLGSPLQLEEVLVKHPKLRVWVMHFGSPFVDEMIAMLFSHPQLHVDVAANNWGFPRAHFYGQLKRLVDAGFAKRILWGSDQMIWPRAIPVAIETIEQAPFLTAEQKRDIFYHNAARFLRLSEAEVARHHAQAAAASSASDLAIRGVTVVDVETGRLLPSQTVVVRGDRIAAMGRDVAIPAGATVVDGAGRYLIPGLWDMHVHVPEPPWDRSVALPLLAAHGVTGVREMFSDCTNCGVDSTEIGPLQALQRLRDDVRAGRQVGPRLLLSSAALDGPPGTDGYEQFVRTAAEAHAAVDRAAGLGVDQIVALPGLSRETFAAAAERARHHGLPLTALMPSTVTPDDALALGVRSREGVGEWVLACAADAERHRAAYAAAIARDMADSAPERPAGWLRYQRRVMDTLLATHDARRCDAAMRRAATASAWQVPRLAQSYRRSRLGTPNAAEDAHRAYAWPSLRDWWRPQVDSLGADVAGRAARERRMQREREIVGRLHRAGVPILAGSETYDLDLVPGFSLHDELALLVEAGLPPLAALRAATLEPARYLAATDSMGTVAVGKVADLVLLDANPLADIRNTQRIRAVVLDGRLLDRAALDGLLAGARGAAQGVTPPTP